MEYLIKPRCQHKKIYVIIQKNALHFLPINKRKLLLQLITFSDRKLVNQFFHMNFQKDQSWPSMDMRDM